MDPEVGDLLDQAKKLECEGRVEESLELLSGLIASGATHPKVLAYRGHTYFGLGAFNEALADLDAALEQKPDAKQTLFLRARCKEQLNDLDGALSDYAKSADLGLEDVWLHMNVGMIHEYRGDLGKARTEFERALQLDPGCETALSFLEGVTKKIEGHGGD